MASFGDGFEERFSEIQLPKSSELGSEMSNKTCEICSKELPKYKCPRCAVWYCGVACYQSPKHLSCSENFYREQVMSELQTKHVSETEKRKMIETLKRVNSEDANKQDILENSDAESLAERMKDLDFADAGFEDIWERLTENERKIFQEVVKEGEVELEQLCTPWWLNKCVQNRDRKILEIEQPTVSENEQKIPEIIQDLPPMNKLLPNKEPSSLLVFNVAEVIAAYVFVYRLYNGDMEDSTIDALDTVISISKVLGCSHNYSDIESCLTSFVQIIKENRNLSGTIDPIEITLDDLCTIINSDVKPIGSADKIMVPLLCISDLYRLVCTGLESIQKETRTDDVKQKKKKYLQIKRKLYFMASWALENEKCLSGLKDVASYLRTKLRNYWKNVEKENEVFDNNIKSIRAKSQSKLIQELN